MSGVDDGSGIPGSTAAVQFVRPPRQVRRPERSSQQYSLTYQVEDVILFVITYIVKNKLYLIIY